MRLACFVIDDSTNSKFYSACDKLLLVFQILGNIRVCTMLFFMSSNFSEGLLDCQSWLNFVSGRCFLSWNIFFLVQRLSWDFGSCGSFLFFLFLVCSASNNAQSWTGTAPDIRFGKDKKKTGLSSNFVCRTDYICCTRLNFFVLFIALAWNGYNFDLHKQGK